MGSCFSFLFVRKCNTTENECYYDKSPERKYDINNPHVFVCINCGKYHTNAYSIHCPDCQLIAYESRQNPKPSAPPL